MERQLNMIQGQASYLQAKIVELQRRLPKRRTFDRPKVGLYE
jgi:prefoldin subunit 5